MEVKATHETAAVLSHVEALYRPGERQLAIALFEALGCKIYETDMQSPSGSFYISVHPHPTERTLDNVLYLAEMPAEQKRLEEALRKQIEIDEELRTSRRLYRETATDRPYGLSHVAIRYPTYEMLEEVLSGLEERFSSEVKSRVVLKIFRPGDSPALGDSIQAFIYTDIAVAGISAFGQVFELAAYGQYS